MGLEQLITNAISRVNGVFVDVEYFDGATTKTVRASIRRDAEFIGEMMQSVDTRTEISLLESQVSRPKRGDTITESDGTAWEVESRIGDDGEFIDVSVREL